MVDFLYIVFYLINLTNNEKLIFFMHISVIFIWLLILKTIKICISKTTNQVVVL